VNTYISGSNGFIGGHLKKVLIDPICVPHQELSTFTPQPYDYFYFLSSYGNLADQGDVEETIKANLSDVVEILNKSDKNFKSFVYFSSSSVKLPRQTVYSRAKRAAEEVLLSYIESQQLPICIIRPFSVTGVGEQSKHLIPTLIRSCLLGERINFVPEPTHDFIDVSDVIDGIINLSYNKAKGIFELGSGKKYSNDEVLKIVERETGKKANINIVPSLRDYDNKDWVSTNFRSRSWGWLPKKPLEKSIREMVKDFKSLNKQ
jgi:nucleoside-diphosphate-sugar epimerase